VSEVRAAHETTEKAFNQVISEVRAATKTLSSIGCNSSEADLNDGSDPFAGLRSELEHLHRIIGSNTALTERIEKAGCYASETTRSLTDKIENVVDMNRDTRHMSLNAIIKSAHIGDSGRTLEVLARELTDLARESNVFADDVKAVLVAIDGLTSSPGQEEAAAGPTGEHFDTALLSNDLADITEAYERINEKSLTVQNKVSALEKRLAGLDTLLRFLPGFADRLEDHLTTLSAVSGELAPWAGSVSNAEAMQHLGVLAERYTMDQERDIHNRIMSVGQPEAETGFEDFSTMDVAEEQRPTEEEAGTVEKTDDDDLGDNVDLF
jgi:hypothetical protein